MKKVSPSLLRAQGRYYYRAKSSAWLYEKRMRLAARLLSLEDVLVERGEKRAMPALMREWLRVNLQIGGNA